MAEPVLWEWMTWEEIGALRDSGMDMAILPVGSTEQHGPHLSVNVDSISAELVAKAVSAETGVPVLPTLPYGVAWGHTTKWPGTLSISPSTLIAAVTEIGDWLWDASKFGRLLILNGHFTNYAPLRCALETLRFKNPKIRIALRSIWDISPRIHNLYFAEGDDWHANAAETSLMMEYFPLGVRRTKLEDDPDRTADLFFAYPVSQTSKNGATGLISKANPALGKQIFEWAVQDLSAQVRKALTEEPPFPSHLE